MLRSHEDPVDGDAHQRAKDKADKLRSKRLAQFKFVTPKKKDPDQVDKETGENKD